MNNKPASLNANSSLIEITKLHDLANQTENQLQTAIDLNMERNEQLNKLLDQSDLLLLKNQAFGLGVMDYRKDIESKQSLSRLKYIAIGILLLTIMILIIILNIVLNHANNLPEEGTSIIIE